MSVANKLRIVCLLKYSIISSFSSAKWVSSPINFKNKTNQWGFRPTLLNARNFTSNHFSK